MTAKDTQEKAHRLHLLYRTTVVPAMRARFGYPNDLAVPRVLKVVLNVGVGRIAKDKALLDNVVAGLTTISGQKPVPTAAKKSVASFKSRKGMLVGYRVTLRGRRKFDFMDRLISVALPRTHDFRGLKASSVDGRGNLTIGIKEHIVFPEISTEQARSLWGFEVTVVTNASSRAEGVALLQLFGFPIRVEE